MFIACHTVHDGSNKAFDDNAIYLKVREYVHNVGNILIFIINIVHFCEEDQPPQSRATLIALSRLQTILVPSVLIDVVFGLSHYAVSTSCFSVQFAGSDVVRP